MNRRDLLKAGLLGAFLPASWIRDIPDIKVEDGIASSPLKDIAGKRYYSPFCSNFGIAQKIKLSINYYSDQLGELIFPVEAIVDITYEHGSEKWSGYNPKNHAIRKFNMDRFFHAPFIEDELLYCGHIELDGVKYRITEVTYFGTKG